MSWKELRDKEIPKKSTASPAQPELRPLSMSIPTQPHLLWGPCHEHEMGKGQVFSGRWEGGQQSKHLEDPGPPSSPSPPPPLSLPKPTPPPHPWEPPWVSQSPSSVSNASPTLLAQPLSAIEHPCSVFPRPVHPLPGTGFCCPPGLCIWASPTRGSKG